MSISYPLALPDDETLIGFRLTAMSVVGYTDNPFTKEIQVQEFQGQRWEVEATLPVMERAEAEAWHTFFLKLNGRKGTFLLGDPLGRTPRGTAGGTPLINGASQTGNSLITDGWSAGATFKAGDYFQLGIGTSSRLFKNLSDVTADGSGNATLDIWPSIWTAYADNTALTITNAKGTFRLSSNEMGVEMSLPFDYNMSFGCVSLPVV